jgi:transposase
MHVQRNKRKHNNGKVYRSVLLRQCYYDEGKTKQKTLANLSKLPDYLVRDIEALIRKDKSGYFKREDLKYKDGFSYGDTASLFEIMKDLGLDKVIYSKNIPHRKLIISMILARILHPGSKLENIRWLKKNKAIQELISIDPDSLKVDHLYEALDFLKKRIPSIEKKLFKMRSGNLNLFLFDITSVYFEGQRGDLKAYGYNRDRKRGKKQIVVGLVCDKKGYPLSIEVFKGNTKDSSTLLGKIDSLKERYNINRGIMIGDRGMIIESKIDTIQEKGFQYITAITHGKLKELMLDNNTPFQLDLFDEKDIVEIAYNNRRYILCKSNERHISDVKRFEQLLNHTEDKLKEIQKSILNKRLTKKDKIGIRVGRWINKWKVGKYFNLNIDDGKLEYELKEELVNLNKKLCGCYVITTDISKKEMDKKKVLKQYKDLSLVERAFRTIKTTLLRIRPVYHWKDDRIKAHTFLCMLAYYIVVEMRNRLTPLFKNNGNGKNYKYTFDDIITNLANINLGEIHILDLKIMELSELTDDQKEILKYLRVKLIIKKTVKHYRET